MAAFAESDVTIALTRKEDFNGVKVHFGTATLGDGALTYATGGVPCGKAKFGAVSRVLDIVFTSASTNLVPEYDITNSKIKLKFCDYDAGADGALIEYTNGGAPAAMTLRFIAYLI